MGNICYLGAGQNTRQANLVEWIILQRGKLPSTRGEGHAGVKPDLRPLYSEDWCLDGGADRGGDCASARGRVPRAFHSADIGEGVPYGRASLPGWDARLRVLLPGRRVVRVRSAREANAGYCLIFGYAFGCANLYRLLFPAPSERQVFSEVQSSSMPLRQDK
jgi:hypothetical protein